MVARSFFALLLVCTSSCLGRGGFDAFAPPGWWDEAWTARRPITLDNTARSQQLFEFPVLVQLDDGFDYETARADGADLRFVEPGGVVLAHETEHWTTSGTSVIWVRVPKIPAAGTTDIWLYYGNDSATDPQDPAAVWSADFGGVWHLNGDANDSSPAQTHGTNFGAGDEPGVAAGSLKFDGDDYVFLGQDVDTLRNVAGATLSALANVTQLTTPEPHLIGFSIYTPTPPTNSSRASLIVEDPGTVFSIARAADSETIATAESTPGILSVDRWYYLVAVIDYAGDSVSLYVDGELVGERSPFGFARSRTSDTPSSTAVLGAEEGRTTDFFIGTLDEVRVARVTRSADWIAAQHAVLMTNDFVMVGPAERVR